MMTFLWFIATVPFRKISSFLAIIKTKLLFTKAGKGTRVPLNVEVKYPENVRLGKHVYIGPLCTIGAHAKVVLGDNVRLSKGVTLETAGLDFSVPVFPYRHQSAPINIGDGVWIGARALVLGGVTIGENSVIGAGSVVVKDIPPYSVAVGNPARVVRTLTAQ